MQGSVELCSKPCFFLYIEAEVWKRTTLWEKMTGKVEVLRGSRHQAFLLVLLLLYVCALLFHVFILQSALLALCGIASQSYWNTFSYSSEVNFVGHQILQILFHQIP